MAPPGSRPVVAVVGRPNVGKSTLVNRIVGRREAIVEERPGVTRDRKVLDAEWAGREFSIVDTGGWLAAGDSLARPVSAQAERAIAEAAVVLLVVDATVGITEEDARVAGLLRRLGRPTLVVANKVDGDSRDIDAWVFSRLGLGDPYPVSAVHGRGTGDLLDDVVARLPVDPETPPADQADIAVPSVAIVGRPNVGKSTLFNRLIGDERSVVHDLPGTTRDSIDTLVSTADGDVSFIDTAGMRRRAKEAEGAEYYSLVRALQALDRADAALLVIDATEGITRQDQRLAERVDAAGQPGSGDPQQVGTARHRPAGPGRGGPRGPAGLPGLRPGAQGQRPHRPGGPPAVPGPADHARRDQATGGDRGAEPGPGRGPGRPPLPGRPGPLRHPGGDGPAHLHPVRHQGHPRPLPAVPGTEASESISASARPRWCSGSGAELPDPGSDRGLVAFRPCSPSRGWRPRRCSVRIAAALWGRAAARLARAARRIEAETASSSHGRDATELARAAFDKDLHTAVLYAVLTVGFAVASISRSAWYQLPLLAVSIPVVVSIRYAPRFFDEARLAENRAMLERRAEEVLAQEELAPRRWADRLAPEVLPHIEGFELGRVYEPGTGMMAGDFYDVFVTSAHRMAVVIGDVAGHGIEPSITAFQVKYLLRTFLRTYRDPAQALEELNQVLSTSGRPEDLVSVCVVVFDTDAGTLRHASAGHPAAWLWQDSEMRALRSTGPLLTLDPAATYLSREVPLTTGRRPAALHRRAGRGPRGWPDLRRGPHRRHHPPGPRPGRHHPVQDAARGRPRLRRRAAERRRGHPGRAAHLRPGRPCRGATTAASSGTRRAWQRAAGARRAARCWPPPRKGVPWHFKLMLVALAVYMVYRIYWLAEWLPKHI